LPSESAERLVSAYENNDPNLRSFLEPFVILEIKRKEKMYVGTIVGESTSKEFRLAVAHEEIREQDIIAVDAELRQPGNQSRLEKIRIWAKVQNIERLNPLFPSEAGHELAATRTNPFDTVLSLSREMVTAVCQVLGVEPLDGSGGGKLDQLRYPPQPASSAYRPESPDIARVVLGELETKQSRALDIAYLANRPEVDVSVDGHAIVSRHLAILAMTGAGKSWTARRIIEELAKKNYPIVIFDPHGDYTGLADIEDLSVTRYYAQFPVFEEDSETIADIVSTLGYSFTDTMRTIFPDVVQAAKAFYIADPDSEEMKERVAWLADRLGKPELLTWGIKSDMWLIAHIAEVGEIILRSEDNGGDKQQLQDWGWERFDKYTKTDKRTLEGIKKRAYRASSVLRRMEQTNQKIARSAEPLPTDRTKLVQYSKVSVVSLAGYTSDFQATIYSLVANDIFDARVQDRLKLPVLFVLEEAHNFVPARANTNAEQTSITTTKQIAQEGRKFGVGLILISQRPSRLDETTLAMCNSFIIMRMVNPADQNFVRKVIESLGEDEAKLLPDLDKGEAILSGQLINFPVLVKMKPPKSQGEREEKDAFEALEEAHRDSISSSGGRR
jgi:DNA helicase HerA-like ATPase